MLIDDFMPVYDFSEKHDIIVRASPAAVARALETADFSESFIVRWLLRLRGLRGENVTLASLKDTKFRILAEKPNEEVVIGLAGKFWTPTGAMQDVDASNFREFDKPGFAKAAWNFMLQDAVHKTNSSPETLLTTETRIRCMDEKSRRSFGFYWTFISFFSGWIREEMLAIIKKRAEN